MAKRLGDRKERKPRGLTPRLGSYFIVTDTKKTEKNYMEGLRDSIPPEMSRLLTVKVIKASTEDLVEKAKEMAALCPQFGKIWIVFDRDRVVNFDTIIEQAEKAGIGVGWSNPCIETWFSTYWGNMLPAQDSVTCCSQFSDKYKKVTGQEYDKADSTIYKKLCETGDESQAIQRAEIRLKSHIDADEGIPSKMIPCTTVHILVKEIKSKIRS